MDRSTAVDVLERTGRAAPKVQMSEDLFDHDWILDDRDFDKQLL